MRHGAGVLLQPGGFGAGTREDVGIGRIHLLSLLTCPSPVSSPQRGEGWERGDFEVQCTPCPCRSCPFLMNAPLRYYSKAIWSSSCVFITVGPYHATGSLIGLPEMSRKRTASFPAETSIRSPSSKRARRTRCPQSASNRPLPRNAGANRTHPVRPSIPRP